MIRLVSFVVWVRGLRDLRCGHWVIRRVCRFVSDDNLSILVRFRLYSLSDRRLESR